MNQDTVKKCLKEILTLGIYAEDIAELLKDELRDSGYADNVATGMILETKLQASVFLNKQTTDAEIDQEVLNIIDRFNGLLKKSRNKIDTA